MKLRIILVIIILSVSFSSIYSQFQVQVVSNPADQEIALQIQSNLIEILQIININKSMSSKLISLESYCTTSGHSRLSNLLSRSQISFERFNFIVDLLIIENRGYQIRDIEVRNKNSNILHYFIFDFNNNAKIIDLKFCFWNRNSFYQYDNMVSFKDRKKIEDSLDSLYTAYHCKNIIEIKKFFKITPEIIVGRIVNNDILYYSRQNNEYFKKLKNIFYNNDKIEIIFPEIYIDRHSCYPEIYGVSIMQIWKSKSYNDQGWLFLVYNFSNPKIPVIQYRRWFPNSNKPPRINDKNSISSLK